MAYDAAEDKRQADLWKQLEASAQKLSDQDLVAEAKNAARAFVVLWREADSRRHQSDFVLEVGILQDRIGILVEGYRRRPL